MTNPNTPSHSALICSVQRFFKQQLLSFFSRPCFNSHLDQAAQYSLFAPGKYFRPLLVFAGFFTDINNTKNQNLNNLNNIDQLLNISCQQYGLHIPAIVIECIHVFSLIHDDLPDMDDDNLRRGQAANHIEFNPATAILAGDYLHSLGFQILTDNLFTVTDSIKLKSIDILSKATMAMEKGQDLDCRSDSLDQNLETLEKIHSLKTGALIQAGLKLGAILNPNLSIEQIDILNILGQNLGLAFQIQDDILDVTQSSKNLGKTTQKPCELNKLTYPNLLGLDGAQLKLKEVLDQIKDDLERLNNPIFLECLFNWLISRKN